MNQVPTEGRQPPLDSYRMVNDREVEVCGACGTAKYLDEHCPRTPADPPPEPEVATVWDLPSNNGVWIAHYRDGDGLVVFATEIEALRHAVSLGGGMDVTYAAYGDEDWRRETR